MIQDGLHEAQDAGEANELRMRRRLWADVPAMRGVRALGLTEATIRRFRLGLREPYAFRSSGEIVERAVVFPVLGSDWSRTGRWGYLNLPGVTTYAPHPVGWGAGPIRTCWSRPVTPKSTLLVVGSILDMWLVSQTVGEAFGSLVVACPSQPGGIPVEWRNPVFWTGFRTVVLGLAECIDEEGLATAVGRTAVCELRRCVPHAGEGWSDLVRMGGSASEIRSLIDAATPWAPAVAVPHTIASGTAGDFAADPIAIEGAFVNGRMHHPITVERREVQDGGVDGARVVQRYVVRILRSDGVLLDVERLPAPRGTPAAGRVVALSDGTRIVSEPQPGKFGSWRFESIHAFTEARAAGVEPVSRKLPRLYADVEAHLRSCVWLPHPADYALAALFVVATFVHRVFDAFPILLVNGPKGSGKSECGQAIASLSCNGIVAGRISPAGLVRLLAESRGTVVLDDLEAIGAGRSSDDVVQILKTSYKANTARRVAPGRDGRVEVTDFFAPKVVTNIGGADAVLLSRMLAVRTGLMPLETELPPGIQDIAALRDELHTWAMCEAVAVRDAYTIYRDLARDRSAEIAAPLRAVADLVGHSGTTERLESALAAAPVEAAEPIETIISRVLRRLVEEEAVAEVAMPRLLLEIALSESGDVRMPSAETLGRLLIAIGARDGTDRVDRRRLHGEVVRIYRLADSYRQSFERPTAPPADAFAFCAKACTACRFDSICSQIVPGLRIAKTARSR